jgi:hypothetical protein
MRRRNIVRRALTWMASALGLTLGAYAAYAGVTWFRYGHPSPGSPDDDDPLLDTFMPEYEVAERHRVHIAAPADLAFAAACEQDLMALPVVRAIFKTREIALGGEPDTGDTSTRTAGAHEIDWMGRAGGGPESRNRDGRSYAAVVRERGVSSVAAG